MGKTNPLNIITVNQKQRSQLVISCLRNLEVKQKKYIILNSLTTNERSE